ncbi:MAG TPA: hypothetical protein VHJ59_01810 [Nitrososphaera sp.]|nr:hypothetical protein [Nitrososphaera sp.]
MPQTEKHLKTHLISFFMHNTDQDSAQYQLWHSKFLCKMRAIDTLSTDYIKIFGTFTTGDALLDRQSQNEIVYRRLTVIQMIEYYNNNTPLYIKNPEDSKTIYILIQTHLQNWQKELQVSLRKDNAPLEELAIMDRFADAVYEHAKWYLDDALIGTPFARTLARDHMSVLNLLRAPESKTYGASVQPEEKPKRESMSTVFSETFTRAYRK